jgi:hypothetical protein
LEDKLELLAAAAEAAFGLWWRWRALAADLLAAPPGLLWSRWLPPTTHLCAADHGNRRLAPGQTRGWRGGRRAPSAALRR